jgi:cell wall-associated NlpC family hydrolase
MSRKRLATVLTGGALAAAVGFMPSSPASAQPDIDSVQARVDTLYHQAEQASERYNEAKLELTSLKRDLGLLKSDQGRQDARLQQVRRQVQDSVIRQYEGQSIDAVGQVVVSRDPSRFLSQLATMSAYNDMQDQLYASYTTELKSLGIRSDATAKRAAQVAAVEHQLGADKATIDKKLAQARALLGDLKAKARQQVVSRSVVRTAAPAPTATAVPASGGAAAAVQFAMAQVGEAYVYGAAGPDAWDCSGLTMMAWAQAGVSLPHSSSAQYSSGPHIAESDLQPGDLVFYYSPISHVGMYIGNGMIVNAENPSVGVKVTSLHSMPYVGAVRPG